MKNYPKHFHFLQSILDNWLFDLGLSLRSIVKTSGVHDTSRNALYAAGIIKKKNAVNGLSYEWMAKPYIDKKLVQDYYEALIVIQRDIRKKYVEKKPPKRSTRKKKVIPEFTVFQISRAVKYKKFLLEVQKGILGSYDFKLTPLLHKYGLGDLANRALDKADIIKRSGTRPYLKYQWISPEVIDDLFVQKYFAVYDELYQDSKNKNIN